MFSRCRYLTYIQFFMNFSVLSIKFVLFIYRTVDRWDFMSAVLSQWCFLSDGVVYVVYSLLAITYFLLAMDNKTAHVKYDPQTTTTSLAALNIQLQVLKKDDYRSQSKPFWSTPAALKISPCQTHLSTVGWCGSVLEPKLLSANIAASILKARITPPGRMCPKLREYGQCRSSSVHLCCRSPGWGSADWAIAAGPQKDLKVTAGIYPGRGL